jgi:hypothetical protein
MLTMKQQLAKAIQLMQNDPELEEVLLILAEFYLYECSGNTHYTDKKEMH